MGTHYGTTTIRRQSNGIESTIIDYQQSSSGTTPPTGSWSTSPPTVSAGYYLWTRKTTKYTNGETDVEYSVGYKGTNGTSPCLLELSNDEDSVFVGTDKTLDVTSDYELGTTELLFYVGSKVTTSNVTYGYEFGTDGMSSYVSVALNGNVATIALKNGFNIQSSVIKFYAEYSSVKYYANYRIKLIPEGKDGVNYKLSLPFNSVSIDKDGNYPTIATSYAKILKNGGEVTDYAIEGLTWSISVDGSAKYTNKTTKNIPASALISSYSPKNKIEYTLKFNGVVIDVETVPVVKDGIDGTTITSTEVTYQKSTSGTTPPTGTWSATIPSVSAGQYLWTRTETTYSDGNVTTQYSVGRSGTNGATPTIGNDGFWYINGTNTGIKAEGKDGDDGTAVKILGTYASLSALNSAHPSGNQNGDGYIVGTHLYVWTDTAFTDVGQIKGNDGTTYYTHIAWANTTDNSDGSFTTSNPSGAAYKYMGTLVDTTKSDSTDYTKYKWTYIKGADGVNGEDGLTPQPQLLNDTGFDLLSNNNDSQWIKGTSGSLVFGAYDNTKYVGTAESTTGFGNFITQVLDDKIQASTYYCLSYLVRCTTTTKGGYYIRLSHSVKGSPSSSYAVIDTSVKGVRDGAEVTFINNDLINVNTSTGTWTKHYIYFKTKSSVSPNSYIVFSKNTPPSSASTNIQFAQIKLERGTVATPWCQSEADKKGEQGIPGMSGKTLRNRGKYNATTIGTTGDMLINVDGGFCDYITYVDGNNQGKFRLADGVTEWTKSYYIKNGTKTSSLVKPSFSGTNAVWTKFNEMKDLAVGMLIADSVNASNMNVVEAFFGDAGSGVTQNDDGTLTINSTANGWVIKGGEIRHTKTGFKLKSDGTLDSGVSGELTLRADSLKCLNNQNEKVMWLDDKGNLTTSGAVVNAIQEIDVANGKNTHLLIPTTSSNLIESYDPVSNVHSTTYMLDVLRCGSVVVIKNCNKHILVPFYHNSNDYRRTSTRFETGNEHLITEAEMRRLIGKKIIIYTTAFTGNNYIFLGPVAHGKESYQGDDFVNGCLNIDYFANKANEQGEQINVANNAFMIEMALGYSNGGMSYFWRKVHFTSTEMNWDE